MLGPADRSNAIVLPVVSEHFHGSEHHHDSAGLCHDHPHSDGDEGDGDAHACGHAADRMKREGTQLFMQ